MLLGTYIKGHIDFANGTAVKCQLTGSKLIADQSGTQRFCKKQDCIYYLPQ